MSSYVSEHDMLKSIEVDGKPWLTNQGLVVQYIKGMWHVFYGWQVGNNGITLHRQPHRQGLISTINQLAHELE